MGVRGLWKLIFFIGLGITAMEVDKDDMRENFTRDRAISIVDKDTDKLAAVIYNVGSPVCRSTKPLLHTNRSVVSEAYRGKGLGKSMYATLFININVQKE